MQITTEALELEKDTFSVIYFFNVLFYVFTRL